MIQFNLWQRTVLLCYIILTLSSCSSTIQSQHRNYIYNEQSSVASGHGVVIAKVFDNRPEEEPSGFFDQINKVLDKPRLMLAQSIRGKEIMAAQVVLLGPEGQKYYLGDYYSPDFRVGIKLDLGASDRYYRKTTVGDKNDFQVYSGMAAYSVISLSEGEYSIIASAYYNKEYTNVKDFMYQANHYKKFHLSAGEVLYIGDIAASTSSCAATDNFNQAKEFVAYAYPNLSAKLTFRPLN